MVRADRLVSRLGAVGGPEEKRSPRRRIVVYMLLIAASILLLAVSTSAPLMEVRKGVNFALGPIQEVLAGGARSVGSVFAAFTEVDQLRKDNRDLASQLEAAQQQAQQLDVLRAENARLSQILGTRKALDYKSVAAYVVARTHPPSSAPSRWTEARNRGSRWVTRCCHPGARWRAWSPRRSTAARACAC